MRSSSRAPFVAFAALLAGLAVSAWAPGARAQTTPAGFAVDRLYTSAPGAGWLVMDTVDEHGGLGGAATLTTSYAHNPVVVSSGRVVVAVIVAPWRSARCSWSRASRRRGRR